MFISFSLYASIINNQIEQNSVIYASDINSRFQEINDALLNKELPLKNFNLVSQGEEVSKSVILDNFNLISEVNFEKNLGDEILSSELNIIFNDALSAINNLPGSPPPLYDTWTIPYMGASFNGPYHMQVTLRTDHFDEFGITSNDITDNYDNSLLIIGENTIPVGDTENYRREISINFNAYGMTNLERLQTFGLPYEPYTNANSCKVGQSFHCSISGKGHVVYNGSDYCYDTNNLSNPNICDEVQAAITMFGGQTEPPAINIQVDPNPNIGTYTIQNIQTKKDCLDINNMWVENLTAEWGECKLFSINLGAFNVWSSDFVFNYTPEIQAVYQDFLWTIENLP